VDSPIVGQPIVRQPIVRPIERRDLEAAQRIFRLAFGTFLGVPDPANFGGDKDLVSTRWLGRTGDGVVAEIDGRIAGSNMITNWGSFGFFGPLTIRPDLWDRGIAKALLAATMDVFNSWGVKDAGLFTFPHSVKHIGLYQKFGFWPRYLTGVMTKEPVASATPWTGYSQLDKPGQTEARSSCRALTQVIHDGLDVSVEIESVFQQNLGDTVLVRDGDQLDAFAVCHSGPGSEAGSGSCYVKFAAARNLQAFRRLLAAAESFAATHLATRIEAGVNTARADAYRQMLDLGYRTQMQGVAMQKPNVPGFNREDAYVLDDWR
jgi:GNAT superfamily N-acetyltransferase